MCVCVCSFNRLNLHFNSSISTTYNIPHTTQECISNYCWWWTNCLSKCCRAFSLVGCHRKRVQCSIRLCRDDTVQTVFRFEFNVTAIGVRTTYSTNRTKCKRTNPFFYTWGIRYLVSAAPTTMLLVVVEVVVVAVADLLLPFITAANNYCGSRQCNYSACTERNEYDIQALQHESTTGHRR